MVRGLRRASVFLILAAFVPGLLRLAGRAVSGAVASQLMVEAAFIPEGTAIIDGGMLALGALLFAICRMFEYGWSGRMTSCCEAAMIVLRLDRVLADRKIRSKELAERIGLTEVNLSRIKTGKISAVRFSTLDALCRELGCQPGDILEYVPDEPER